ncbi:MAG: ammonium transporter [Candidatus Omnitrophica bacterium]|nr:ammonium transporter [Candidatus Omnitrophota bacterium]
MNSGDTAWVLVSAVLVLLMTPALGFFYGGMVRRKNVLGVLMQCMACLSLVSVLWGIYGYSLAFSKGNWLFGGFDAVMLKGVGAAPNGDYAATIPQAAFMIFQCMFAVITPAVIVGAYAERVKFSAFLLFTVLWLTFVYCPIAHMAWGVGGLFRSWGILDFAGGTVVEINCGIAGLVTALYLGRRIGISHPSLHNIPFVVLGASLLWFGWNGFNAGSALACNAVAVNAFVTTNMAAGAAVVSWAALEWILTGKPTIFGSVTGAIAGLVAITPAAGFVDFTGALIIGCVVSVLSFFAVGILKQKFKYDDSLDAFGVHAVGGFWGMFATGILATKAVNAAGSNGLLLGNGVQLLIQIKCALITIAYCAGVTWIICNVVNRIIPMRVTAGEEIIGLDLSQHHERAYTILD